MDPSEPKAASPLDDDGLSAMEARLAGITLVRKLPPSATATPTRGTRSMSLAVAASSSSRRTHHVPPTALDLDEDESLLGLEAAGEGVEGPVSVSPGGHGAYVQLLRDRNRELELELRREQQALASLQHQHQAQSLELQRVLVASLQRHSSVLRSNSGGGRHALTPDSLEDLLGNLEATRGQLLQAGRAVDGLRPCIADNVRMEGELHRCAMQQADHIKAVDARHPNGIADMTAREQAQLQMSVGGGGRDGRRWEAWERLREIACSGRRGRVLRLDAFSFRCRLKEELESAAQEKDQVVAALDTMLTDIRRGIETATGVLGAAAAVASEALVRVSDAALPDEQALRASDAEDDDDEAGTASQPRESAAPH
jgi:hypothetical protein